MGSPGSSSESEIENPLVYMVEKEKEALHDVITMNEEGWKMDDLFLKSELWESLQWAPLYPSEGRWEDKSIYLQVQSLENTDYCMWFAVPIKDLLDGDDNAKKELSPVLGEKPRMLQRTVAFPPGRIVALGGSFPKNTVRKRTEEQDATSVSCYDLNKKVWQDYPPMLAKRDYPTVVVFGGRIYVFGGLRAPFTAASFLEKYHPEVGEVGVWDRVEYFTKDMPPLYNNIPGVFSDPGGRKHLLFYSSPVEPERSLYTLDLVDGSIRLAETPFPQLYQGCQVVDGILYAYVSCTRDVRAYDLATKIWLTVPVIESNLLEGGIYRLLQVGDDMLCLVEEHFLPIDEASDALPSMEEIEAGVWAVHFRFKVFKLDRRKDDEAGLRVDAKLIVSRTFYCPGGCCLFDSLII